MNKVPSVPPVVPVSQASTPRFLWALLVIGAAGYFIFFAFNPQFLSAVGINYFGVWFLDSFAILASSDARARGLDVYAANPLDYLQRPHVYSRWWLEVSKLGLNRAHNFQVGLTLVLAFFGAALAGLRPCTRRELLWYFLVLCSSPVLLAVHRANNDLLIFLLLAPVVPCLLSTWRPARFFAVLLIAAATALKIYPAAALLVLLVGHDTRGVRWGLGFAAFFMTVVLVGLMPDFARMGAMLAHTKAEGLMTFGAGNLFGVLGITSWWAVTLGGILGVVIAGIFSRSRLFAGWDVATADQVAWFHFVLGAVLLTTCFLTGMNFAYRWVFALWLAPFLWKASHDVLAPPRVRRFAALTAGLLLVVLWADPLVATLLTHQVGKIPGATLVRWADGFFLLEQPFTWAFFACLTGWLAHFMRRSVRLFNNAG